MNRTFQIVPLVVVANPFRSKAACVAALISMFALSGCATFSPDGGMAVVAGVAGETIKKDVVSIRSGEDAEWARGAVQRLLRRPLTDSPVKDPKRREALHRRLI